MPICNIVDRRKNRFNVEVMGIFEYSLHDNTVEDATQFEEGDVDSENNVDCLEIGNATIELAIKMQVKNGLI